jgi:hypothetical protein
VSTSLLQWELDTPLCELSRRLGASVASRIYRASAATVRNIVDLTTVLAIDCHCAVRPSLYLAGNRLPSEDLLIEERQRQDAGLPSRFLTGDELYRLFGFRAEATLYSEGAAEANPVLLARGFCNALVRAASDAFIRKQLPLTILAVPPLLY